MPKRFIIHRPTEISLTMQPKTHKNPRDSGNSCKYICLHLAPGAEAELESGEVGPWST